MNVVTTPYPRFRPTEERFEDPTTRQRMRVWLTRGPASGGTSRRTETASQPGSFMWPCYPRPPVGTRRPVPARVTRQSPQEPKPHGRR